LMDWGDTEEAQRAFIAGRDVLRMFRAGRDFSEVRSYLIEHVFNFRPGSAEAPSGGSLPKFARDPRYVRAIDSTPRLRSGRR